MSADPAYEELHHLVDRLSPGQASRVLRLVRDELAESATAGPVADSPQREVSFIGIGEGDEDLSERVEEILAERFNRSM
ncbi:hypothetical protein GT755_27030 [Herbidospora sp. NEAU-GS84]|uniref:Uncharacterized protein n=1 Tax=Herbidospora solisilvae TaxID=2696284 RepID=A0A7C9J5W7_9ACTN|nr:hypothetical protein [Herbidospora solisilvae]NAS25325.1 hypothetical protein [Herbidospora solisilvae]